MYGRGRVQDYIGEAIPPYQSPDHQKLYGTDKRLVSGGMHYKGVVGKCTWCVHRVDKGLLPACVANCPVSALVFGDLDDPKSDVSKRLRQKDSFRLLEEIGTQPRVYYVGRPPPKENSRLSFTQRDEVRA